MRLLMEMVSGLMILGPPAVGFLIAQQVIATSASAPESAVTTQRSAPVDQPVSESGQNSAPKAVASVATAQEAQPAPAALEGPAQTGFAENPLTPTTSAIPPCDKPDGLRLSRVVQIDTTGGPEFGPQHLKGYDFLRDKQVVLTFDRASSFVSGLLAAAYAGRMEGAAKNSKAVGHIETG